MLDDNFSILADILCEKLDIQTFISPEMLK